MIWHLVHKWDSHHPPSRVPLSELKSHVSRSQIEQRYGRLRFHETLVKAQLENTLRFLRVSRSNWRNYLGIFRHYNLFSGYT
jgi:hypothetical protein